MLKHLAAAVGTFCIISASTVPVIAAIGNEGAVRDRGFRYYPGFLRKEVVIEAAHDKGLTVELIVRCSVGWGIITLSKVEQLYCLPDHSCTRNLNVAVGRLCR